MLSDAELDRLCAIHIMGWPAESLRLREGVIVARIVVTIDGRCHIWGGFNPTQDEMHCAALLDKMAADGYRIALGFGWADGDEDRWGCEFWSKQYPFADHPTIIDADRKRAVVIAALSAKGVEVGEEAES